MVSSFEELCENRKKYKEGLAANEGFEGGIHKLLTELYPDKAHFIYELLQNAEDAKATKVSFILERDYLIFRHNGIKLFTLEDIDSITSIANSTKEKDANSIGKFGVGFKAVFAYTNTPQIHSGKWHFQIDDLVIPREISDSLAIAFDEHDTVFKFPFNNPQKNKTVAYQETEAGLKSLTTETILFLNNIAEIEWRIERNIENISKTEKKNIVQTLKNGKVYGTYLSFRDNSVICKTSKGEINVDISLAYKLEENKDKKYEIVPADTKNTVFVYFPAEKERPGLRFYINAPFATEVSRASIKNCSENEQLIDALINLQKKSFAFIKENKMLTTEFLGVLPSTKDELPEMYRPFNTEIVKFFQKEPYVPTKNGDFGPAEGLMKTSSKISDFITDQDIIDIKSIGCDTSEWEAPIWVKNARQQHSSNADNFLTDLKIETWDKDDFEDFFSRCSWDTKAIEICRKIFQRKTNEEIKSFYYLLLNIDEYVYAGSYSSAPIFKTKNGNLVSSSRRNLYWKSLDTEIDSTDEYTLLEDETYLISKNKIDEKITDLFKKFDVLELSLESVYKNIIASYDNNLNSSKNYEIHLKDIRIILKMYKKSKESISQLSNTNWLLSTKYDDDEHYLSASQLYLKTTDGNKKGNEALDAILPSISDFYKKHLNAVEFKDFLAILRQIGINETIWIEESSVKNNPQYYKLISYFRETYHSYGEDYTIYKINELLSENNLTQEISKAIWKLLIDEDDTLQAYYTANQRDSGHRCESTYVYFLMNKPWIYNKDGNLCLPKDVDATTIAKFYHLPEDENNPFLDAIHFGENSKKRKEEQDKKDSIAQEAGFSDADEAEQAKLSLEFCRHQGIDFHRKNEAEFPERSVCDFEGKLRDAQRNLNKSREKEYTVTERSSRISNNATKKDAHDYLLNMYSNEEDEMMCQLCHQIMPFKTRNHEYYFEAIEISDTINKETQMKYLALCPNCAAEYKEWVKKDEEKQKDLIEAIKSRQPTENEGRIDIEFKIHKEDKTLSFTGRHYLDIHTVLAENDTEEEEE